MTSWMTRENDQERDWARGELKLECGSGLSDGDGSRTVTSVTDGAGPNGRWREKDSKLLMNFEDYKKIKKTIIT